MTIPTQLTAQQIEKIRRQIEEREIDNALEAVVNGEDLDQGRISRLEFLATGQITLDAAQQNALLQWSDSEYTLLVRTQVDEQVRALARDWLDTTRGRVWLEERVGEHLAAEIEEETERLEEARADQLGMRFEEVE